MKLTNIKIIKFLALLTAATSIYLFLKQTNNAQNSNELIIGTASGYAPWVSINNQGEYEGFDVEVAQELAKQLNKKLILKDLGSMTSLFTALNQGKIDAIIWGISITSERLKKVAMINYQGQVTTSFPLIFWKKIPANIASIADMNGKKVCVEPASAQQAILNKYPNIEQLTTEKVDDALLNIQYGKADAAFVEPAIAKKFKNKFPEIQILDVPLNSQEQVFGVGIVIKKENNSLIDQATQAIAQLKQTNLIAQFEEKWDIPS